MLKKGRVMFVVFIAFLLLAMACSKDNTEGNKEQQNQNNRQEEQNNKQEVIETNIPPANLVFHSNNSDTEEAFNALFGDRLRKKFPQHTITYYRHQKGQTLPELIASNVTVDILYQSVSYFSQLSESVDLMYDMNDMVKKHNIDLSLFEPTLIQGILDSGNGMLYALPIMNIAQVNYYNKDIFDKLGINEPIDGMYWDEFLTLAKAITRKDGDQHYIGFAGATSFMLQNNPFSLPYLDPKTDKPTFQNELWKKLINTIFIEPSNNQVYKDRMIELNNVPYHPEFTVTQELAMLAFISKYPFVLQDELAKISWDMTAMPTYKDNPKVGMQFAPDIFGVTSMSDDKDAAMEVIKYLTSPEVQMEFSKQGIMPVINNTEVKQAYGTESFFKDKNWSSVFYNQQAPIGARSKYQLTVEGIFVKHVTDAIMGKVDLNTAMRTAVEETEKKVAELKSQ